MSKMQFMLLFVSTQQNCVYAAIVRVVFMLSIFLSCEKWKITLLQRPGLNPTQNGLCTSLVLVRPVGVESFVRLSLLSRASMSFIRNHSGVPGKRHGQARLHSAFTLLYPCAHHRIFNPAMESCQTWLQHFANFVRKAYRRAHRTWTLWIGQHMP